MFNIVEQGQGERYFSKNIQKHIFTLNLYFCLENTYNTILLKKECFKISLLCSKSLTEIFLNSCLSILFPQKRFLNIKIFLKRLVETPSLQQHAGSNKSSCPTQWHVLDLNSECLLKYSSGNALNSWSLFEFRYSTSALSKIPSLIHLAAFHFGLTF